MITQFGFEVALSRTQFLHFAGNHFLGGLDLGTNQFCFATNILKFQTRSVHTPACSFNGTLGCGSGGLLRFFTLGGNIGTQFRQLGVLCVDFGAMLIEFGLRLGDFLFSLGYCLVLQFNLGFSVSNRLGNGRCFCNGGFLRCGFARRSFLRGGFLCSSHD